MSHPTGTGTVRQHAHHFESAEHEFNTSKFGMWLFLVSEVMLFGGLFVAYIIFRNLYPEMYVEASHHLNKIMGGTNTVVLLFSSLTMALAIGAAQRNEPKKSARYLIITLLCACVFMVIKYFEYKSKFHHGLLPAGFFTNQELTHPKAPLFFSLYFVMTGLHGLHVLIGMAGILWVLRRTLRNEFSVHYYTPVEMVGLYWHLVDLIWIYLFPLLYLIG